MDDRALWRRVGDDIGNRRRQLGFSQTKLGLEAGGYKQGVVSDDEGGAARGIPPRRLVGYARVFTNSDEQARDLLDHWLDLVYHDWSGAQDALFGMQVDDKVSPPYDLAARRGEVEDVDPMLRDE